MPPRIVLFFGILAIFFTGCFLRKPPPFKCGYILKNEAAVASYFGPEVQAIDYQPGDTIAYVGASNGYRAAMLAMLVDSLHFYLQDIDTFCLNPGEVSSAWAFYENMHSAPLNSTYELVLGNEHATNLPSGTMEKVVITATFHHFSDTLGMLADLRQVLRPGGRLYIIENVVEEGGKRTLKYCDHPLYTERELTTLFESNGLRVVSIQHLHEEFTKVFELEPK